MATCTMPTASGMDLCAYPNVYQYHRPRSPLASSPGPSPHLSMIHAVSLKGEGRGLGTRYLHLPPLPSSCYKRRQISSLLERHRGPFTITIPYYISVREYTVNRSGSRRYVQKRACAAFGSSNGERSRHRQHSDCRGRTKESFLYSPRCS